MYKPDIDYVKSMIEKLSFSRVASSDDEKKAFNIIEDEIKKYNLAFEYQPFQDDWRESYESNISYRNEEYNVTSTMVYSFMELDYGFADNYDTEINSFLSNDKTKKAVRYYDSIEAEAVCDDENALAFIINNCPNSLQIACKQLSMGKYIPCVYLSVSQNIKFIENENIAIRIKTHIVEREFKNMVIKPCGSSLSPIIVGAHIDTFPGSPGGSDDMFGVAVGLDIIRQCANKNIWIVLFTGEEIDRRGSINFVKTNLKENNIKPRIYMNIDSGIEKGSGEIGVTITPETLRENMAHLFKEKYNVGDNVFESNDASAFHEVGVPIFWSWAYSPFRSHSIYDTLNNVDQIQLSKMLENYALAVNYLIC